MVQEALIFSSPLTPRCLALKHESLSPLLRLGTWKGAKVSKDKPIARYKTLALVWKGINMMEGGSLNNKSAHLLTKKIEWGWEEAENRNGNSRNHWQGWREADEGGPSAAAINYMGWFLLPFVLWGLNWSSADEGELLGGGGRWIRDFAQSSDSEWTFQAKLRGLWQCRPKKGFPGTMQGRREGARGGEWQDQGRYGVGGREGNSTIMRKGRPASGALISNNDSHVVLFISAIQESIEGAFIFQL